MAQRSAIRIGGRALHGRAFGIAASATGTRKDTTPHRIDSFVNPETMRW